jgi:hypothetical protein
MLPPKKPETYDEYWFIFQNIIAAMDRDIGQDAADEILCFSINDGRRFILIEEDNHNNQTLHWRTDK